MKKNKRIIDRLSQLEWLLHKKVSQSLSGMPYLPPYGDVTELNRSRLIMDSVGKETLNRIAQDAICLLDSSVAIYEANGDYACGMFSSGWCREMDSASRKLCRTEDNDKALACGKWLCHENCWNDSAKAAIETGRSTDIECIGGVHLYGEPIYAGDKIIGAINIGYGDPPKDPQKLKALADLFCVEQERLEQVGSFYESRPGFLVDVAKNRLKFSAMIIGEIVQKTEAKKILEEREERLRILFDQAADAVYISDVNGRLLEVNEQACRKTGFTRDELLKLKVSDVDSEIGTTEQLREYLDNIKPGRHVTLESHHRKKDGSIFPVEITISLFETTEGTRVMGIARDITQRKLVEISLLENEAKFRTLVDQAPEALFVHDMKGRIVDVNQVTLERYGYKRDQLLLMSAGDIDPDYIDREDGGSFWDHIKEKKQVRFEARHQRKDGSIFPVEVTLAAVKLLGERHIIALADDITERKQAEQTLLDSERILNATGEMGRIGGWEHDLSTGKAVWTKALYDIIEIPYDKDPPGVNEHLSFYPSESRRVLAKVYDKAVEEKIPFDIELPVVTFKGKHLWCRVQGETVIVEGRCVKLRGMFQDITERKLSEEALIKSEKRLSEAQRIARLGDFTWDIETGGITWSDALYDLLKYKKTERIDYEKIKRDIHHPDDLERIEKWLNETISSGDTRLSPNEYRVLCSDGEILYVRTVGVIEREKGKSPKIFATVQDITELKRAEDERNNLKAQLDKTSRLDSIGRLAGGVAHDLNNLISPILGYGEILLEDFRGNDSIREPAKEIVGASIRARDLVRQLLAFSRKQLLEFRPIDLSGLIRKLEKLLVRTIREDISMNFILDDNLPFIKADPGHLEQVVINLAVNAQDAMPEGGELSIETALVELDHAYSLQHEGFVPGLYVMLRVSDTGQGIDADTREHLFEPFFTTKERDKGTGLGLSTVYGIVKQHGGNIWVYSEPGMGTTFKVYLPASNQVPAPEEDVAEELSMKRGGETILLVEDNTQVRKLASTILRRKGYTVLEASEGKDALELLENHASAVHLLLTDVVMPGMNGKELFKRMSYLCPDLRVLYMSGYTDSVIAHHGVKGQGVNFIEKPFSIRRLETEVRKVLDQQAGPSQP